ncbi:MAG TPA: anthranilate phosphoribosyltransferase [Candidatus Thioglobus sp.]|nr:anthranilate phosphoribosyltransferase [Candidatus Thioglobus sp.]HIL20016.1 anthranilate phosphoribosyltransferase [Candidatus Thioglobus sp.]
MSAQTLIHSIIQRIATGPELSKNIELEEASAAMSAILDGEIDDVQSAIFLIALRMKRETVEENFGILDALLQATGCQQADIEDLVDLGDPYSGYNRSIPISAFLPPLLAELGLPCIIHGLDGVTPKFGLTHKHVNQALGNKTELSVGEAKTQLEDNQKGWAYLDQSRYCASLHALVPLRNKIVKRTVVNTVESLIGPIRAKYTHSILGFVHKPYPPIYAALTARAGFDTSLVIRGVEGGVVPSLRQKGLMISYVGEVERARVEIDPKAMGIEQALRAIAFPRKMTTDSDKVALAEYTVTLGRAALSGEKGMFYDGLVYTASLILWHLGKTIDLTCAADQVREVLDSARTLKRL